MKITAIKQQVKRTDRYSIFVDGAYAFSLSESGLLQSGLASGQELDAVKLKKLKKDAGLDKAYYNALRYAAMRPHSQWEMESYLKRKEVDADTTAEIIRRLQSLTMLSDLDFARSWIASRRLLKSTSKRRLRLELMQKHVPDDIIRQALAEDATDERQALRDLVAKKRRRYPERQKLIRYLASQGFNYDDITSVLNEE
jgi:regulatory protein